MPETEATHEAVVHKQHNLETSGQTMFSAVAFSAAALVAVEFDQSVRGGLASIPRKGDDHTA